tara:strand:- start:82 stop:405 length:324 start_codon:yes stop_codon:yes gene_type:complete
MKVSKIQLRKIIMNEVKRILKEGDKHPNEIDFSDDSDDDFDPETYKANPYGYRSQESMDAEYDRLGQGSDMDSDDDDDFDPETYKANPYGYRSQESMDDEYRKLGFD